jgi:hypothetical protein
LEVAVVNDILLATHGGFVLGAAGFREKVAAMLGCRVTPGQPGRPSRKDTERGNLPRRSTLARLRKLLTPISIRRVTRYANTVVQRGTPWVENATG